MRRHEVNYSWSLTHVGKQNAAAPQDGPFQSWSPRAAARAPLSWLLKLLCHRACIYSALDNAKGFSKCLCQFTLPPAMNKNSVLPYPCQHAGIFCLFHFSHSGGCLVVSCWFSFLFFGNWWSCRLLMLNSHRDTLYFQTQGNICLSLLLIFNRVFVFF